MVRVGRFLSNLMNEQKLFRRTVLLWAMIVLTAWSYFLMDATLLTTIGAAGATVVTAIFGILTTVVGFYMQHRKGDDERDGRRK